MLVKHVHADDIESLFYVLVWIMIMYDGPLDLHRRDVDPERTILGPWNRGDATTALVGAGDSKMSFILTEPRKMDFHGQVSPYFHDLLPLADKWREALAKNMALTTTTDTVTFQDVLPIFDDFLTQMPDEKSAEVIRAVQGARADHATLAPVPLIPVAQTSQKRFSEDVRSTDNPRVPQKRFKRGLM